MAESTELTHELLDWDVLKDFDTKRPRPKVESSEDIEGVREKVRRKTGDLGRRALGVVERFTKKTVEPEAQPAVEQVAESATDEKVDDRLALEHYDVVVNRAVQVLGQEQFQEMVEELDVAAKEKTPDEVMEKFREQAGAVRVDAGDLWNAVLMQAKKEKFGGERDRVKFYYKTDIDGLKWILDEKEIVRRDGGTNLLASDVRLTTDRKEDGEWKSGYVRTEAGEVTLLLDGAIVDEASFVALGENPVVSRVDLIKSCLGVVAENPEHNGKPIVRIMKEHGAGGIPVYGFEQEAGCNWETRVFPSEDLRKIRDEWAEAAKKREKLQAEVFDEVDHFQAIRVVRPYANRITMQDANKVVRQNIDLGTEKQRDRADENMVQYFAEILDLEYVPRVKYVYDPKSRRAGRMLRDKETKMPTAVELNRAIVDGTDLRMTIEVCGHELWHARQMEMEARLVQGRIREGEIADEKARAELYQYNAQNYVKPEVDIVRYRDQLNEVEASYFSDLCLKRFDKSVQNSQKPMELLKRKWAGWKRRHFYQGKHLEA